MREFRGNQRFKVLRRLGTGGMGAVYEVEDQERKQRVALKQLTAVSAEGIYRFKREFRVAAGLGHPNLIGLHDLFVGPDEAYFTMELVRGSEFVAHCLRDGSARAADPAEVTAELAAPARVGGPAVCDEARLRPAFTQLVHGLAALHAAGMIHRDIKPSNVLVSREGRTVVLDFGLVTEAGRGSDASLPGALVGTIDYMSPEQVAAGGALTPASDWYGVGILLYEALTGCLPFRGERLEAISAKLRTEPPPARAIDPSVPADLDALCARLLRKQPDERPGAADILAALGASAVEARSARRLETGPRRGDAFLGRSAELDQLHAALERVLRGEAATVFISGPAGVGKTELVGRFVDDAQGRYPGLTLLAGRCYEHEVIAYRAIDPLIDHLSRLWTGLREPEARALVPTHATALRRLFPVLGRIPAMAELVDPIAVVDPQDVRALAFAALRELFDTLARRATLLVALDDLQWIDADTVALLADVMQPPAPPLLLVLVSRESASADAELASPGVDTAVLESQATRALPRSAVARLVRGLPEVAHVTVGPLGSVQAVRLAQGLLGPQFDELAVRIAREARGNPFLVTELCRFVAACGGERSISVRIEDLVTARVDLLGAEAKTLLEIAAVAEEPLHRDLAAVAAELDPSALARALRQLRAARLVQIAGDDDHIEPYHNRIREAVLATLCGKPLRRRHHALALALERVDDTAVERLVRHWLGAGKHARAAKHALDAATRAERTLDFDRAANFYQIAIEAGRATPAERSALLARLGEARANAGRPVDAANAFIGAGTAAPPGRRLELRRRAAEQLLQGGHLSEGVALTEEVLAELGMKLAPTTRRAFASVVASELRLRLRGLAVAARAEHEIAPAELTRIDTCWAVGTGLGMADPTRGADYLFRHLRLALSAGEPMRIARGLAIVSVLMSAYGRDRRADALLERARQLVAGGASDAAEHVTFATAWQHYRRCELVAAGDGFHDAARGFQTAGGSRWETDISRLYHCYCLMWRGRLQELGARVPAYLRDAERRGDRFASISLRTRFGLIWLVRGEVEAARAMVDDGIRGWGTGSSSFQLQHYFAGHSLCEIALYQAEPSAATGRLERLGRAMGNARLTGIPLLRLELELLRGRLALASGEAKAAAAAARRARRVPLAMSAALAELVWAGVHRLRGHDADAVAALARAEAGLERFGLELHLAAARFRRGGLVGGSEGAELGAQATAWLREQGVAAPEALVGLVAPGFAS